MKLNIPRNMYAKNGSTELLASRHPEADLCGMGGGAVVVFRFRHHDLLGVQRLAGLRKRQYELQRYW